MPLPELNTQGNLPPGVHAASLKEVQTRFGMGSEPRQLQSHLLELVVEAALSYRTIKRVLIWGSFVTAKVEPNDLDYSLVVSVEHSQTRIVTEHQRFVVPFAARQYYGTDAGYLLIRDYPFERYIERMDFIGNRNRVPCGIVEISLRGETTEDT
jgi:Family of unknown function (DUF6932)